MSFWYIDGSYTYIQSFGSLIEGFNSLETLKLWFLIFSSII